MTRPDYAGLVEIERGLDGLVRNQLPDLQFVRTLRAAQHEWSHAVWKTALTLGASPPPSTELDRGLSLARRPVFVCGAARSGTTMLRDLLDGHPELIVIPNESGFYTWMEPALMRLNSDRQLPFLACRWLERLVDPPPFWLLGRSSRDNSPYAEFARDFAGWWQVPERRKEARFTSWPLAALALAYAQRVNSGHLPADARMWVEKTPGSERRLTQIWQDFPDARVIQIVRRPEAVLASIKAVAAYQWTRRKTVTHILRNMAVSYRVAANNLRRARDDRYCLVRYEDLTAEPDRAMRRIAEFLGIEPLPSILQPTTAGRPAFNNTSFRTSRPDPRRALDPVDRALLKLAVGRHAAELGYGPSEPSSAQVHSIVGARA